MDMREQVVKFEKFIQENDAKRARAEAKAKQVNYTYIRSMSLSGLLVALVLYSNVLVCRPSSNIFGDVTISNIHTTITIIIA